MRREQEKRPLPEKATKDMIRPTALRRRFTGVRLLALLALAVVVALPGALSSAPAEAAATTFTVNSTGDDADRNIGDSVCDVSRDRGRQCTLRAAIDEANFTDREDTINFNIGGNAGVKTINVGSSGLGDLPNITEAVTINGYSQPGARPNSRVTGSDAVLKIQLNGSDAGTKTNGLRLLAPDCTIKGLVINRFAEFGIEVDLSEATGNTVQGNYVGVSANGSEDLGNGSSGIAIAGASGNTIGGAAPGARNVISGNENNGVIISGPGARDNVVRGNFIGTTASGRSGPGNSSHGVHIVAGSENIIGGSVGADGPVEGVVKAGNLISGNGGDGVTVVSIGAGTGTDNAILSNRISGNAGLGIDLNDDDITNNDRDNEATPASEADLDTGPNNLQNFPRMISADLNPSTGLTTISGEIESTPGQFYVVEVYLAGPVEDDDPSGHGEGPRLVGRQVVRILANDPDSAAPFNIPGIKGVGPDQQATATATSLDTSSGTQIPEDTSEFAQNHNVT